MHRKATCLRLLRYFREERWRVVLLTFIVAVSVAAGVSAPVFMSQAIDAITAAAYERVPGILWWMFGACALYAVLLFFQGRLSAPEPEHHPAPAQRPLRENQRPAARLD